MCINKVEWQLSFTVQGETAIIHPFRHCRCIFNHSFLICTEQCKSVCLKLLPPYSSVTRRCARTFLHIIHFLPHRHRNIFNFGSNWRCSCWFRDLGVRGGKSPLRISPHFLQCRGVLSLHTWPRTQVHACAFAHTRTPGLTVLEAPQCTCMNLPFPPCLPHCP